MQRTISLKLVDPPEEELRCTMRVFRTACNYVSKQIQGGDPVRIRTLHDQHYQDLRTMFGLPSQMAQIVIRLVVGVYRSRASNNHEGEPPKFKRHQLQLQFNRDWSFSNGLLSIRTLKAQRKVRFTMGQFQRRYLNDTRFRRGGARLIERGGVFFLHITLRRDPPPTHDPKTPIGVDRGLRILIVARTPGQKPLIVRGGGLKDYRERIHRLRKRLQSKGTRAAKQLLVHLRRREKRSVTDFCRRVANTLVVFARQFEAPVLVFEELTHIRKTLQRRGKRRRRQAHTWAFRLLMDIVRMRAEEHGIPIVTVDAAYTSQTCPRCGTIKKTHRRRDNYQCQCCGYQNHADVVAVTNLALRWPGVVNRAGSGVPSTTQTCMTQWSLMHKPPTSVGGS